MLTNDDSLIRRIHADLVDSYDEELEPELDDRTVDDVAGIPTEIDADYKESRRRYFRELFRLHGELVKLQDGCAPRATRSSSSSRAATRPARAA